MENKEIIEKEEINISENITQPASEAIEQKPKSNKKKVIVISAVIAVVAICIVAAVIAIVGGNSNSLWKKPFDKESFCYGYNVTPEEFIDKANELNIDNVHHEFEYSNKESIEVTDGESAERYAYDISSFELFDRPAYYSICGVDYYEDNTIRQTVLVFDYKDTFSFDWAYDDLCVSAVQILYAYNAFDADSANDVLNAFKSYSDMLEKAAQNQPVKIYFKYGDFVLYLFENENSESLYFRIQKTDEQGVETLEETMGASLVNLADTVSSNNDKTEATVTENDTTEVAETTQAQKSPEDCFVSTKEIYEQVKPFFTKYGYDIDSWDVTIDDGDVFAAETSSESFLLQDNLLVIKLNKGENRTKGLYYSDLDKDNIQINFDGGEKDKAYELLDVIFDGAQVNDKKLSEYIESEYTNHLNEGNISNWENDGIKYTVGIGNDIVFIMLGKN